MDSTNDPLSEIEGDLKATSENIKADAQRLLEVETEKLDLPPRDPRSDELGEEAAQLGGRIAATTKVQSALADEVADEVDSPD
jgi:hypothetical protein